MKQNQTLFYEPNSNLSVVSFFFFLNIKLFKRLLKTKFVSFMTKVKSNNRNETKSG